MTRLQTSQPDSGVLAVVHPAAGACRLLIASARGARPSVLEAVDLPGGRGDGTCGADVVPRLREHLDRHAVERLIVVLPASRVVCRTCTLPDAGAEQLQQALRLQAEVHHSGAPEHRTAMAVLPAAPGETSRSGLIFTWPESAAGEFPDLGIPDDELPVRYAPDTAGLAALLDGLRPPDPLLWLDRANGTVSLAVTHANGAVFRGTREEEEATETWKRNVVRTLVETALSVGHTGSFAQDVARAHEARLEAVGPGEAKLLTPREIVDAAADRVDGLRAADSDWWSKFGIATGILIAATSELAPLAQLQASAIKDEPSRIRAITAALSRPRTALVTALVCLAVIAFGPVAVSGLRLAILKLRYSDIDERTAALERAKVQLAMYQALDTEAWSMTKLLSDIVCNTPEGIQLEMIRLQHSDQTFSIKGEARPQEGGRTAPEVISQLQEQLADSRLFTAFRPNWGDPNAYGHYQFDLAAKVIRPHYKVPYEVDRDFGVWTLAARQAGEPAPDGTMLAEAVEPAGGGVTVGAAAAPGKPPEGAVVVNTNAPPESPEARDVIPRPVPPRVTPGTGTPTSADDAPGATGATGEGGPDEAGRRPRRAQRGGPGGGPGDAGQFSDPEERGGGGGPLDAYPEALSETDIQNLTMEEVNDQLPKVAVARERARKAGDEEMAARLKREFDLLMARKRAGR